jgi:hypothetical protein
MELGRSLSMYKISYICQSRMDSKSGALQPSEYRIQPPYIYQDRFLICLWHHSRANPGLQLLTEDHALQGWYSVTSFGRQGPSYHWDSHCGSLSAGIISCIQSDDWTRENNSAHVCRYRIEMLGRSAGVLTLTHSLTTPSGTVAASSNLLLLLCISDPHGRLLYFIVESCEKVDFTVRKCCKRRIRNQRWREVGAGRA